MRTRQRYSRARTYAGAIDRAFNQKSSFPLFAGYAAFALLFSNVAANAHPGHGWLDQGAVHAFSSAYHWLVMGLAGALSLLLGTALQNRKVGRRLRILGAALLAVSATAFGMAG